MQMGLIFSSTLGSLLYLWTTNDLRYSVLMTFILISILYSSLKQRMSQSMRDG